MDFPKLEVLALLHFTISQGELVQFLSRHPKLREFSMIDGSVTDLEGPDVGTERCHQKTQSRSSARRSRFQAPTSSCLILYENAGTENTGILRGRAQIGHKDES